MKIHTLQIPPEGKRFEGSDPASVLDVNEAHTVPVAPLHYCLDVGLSDGGLFATGRLESVFRVECVACLESFEYPISVPNFACQVELLGREQVDLTENLREDILLALPAHPHCDWNGLKACGGTTLFPIQEPQSEQPKPVWTALDRLKFQS
jgi:uncharacterized metal-binding protein YceD (DUF177 family)